MKVKRINRYYCDFCKKANCSAPAMKKHELHCTKNPNRTCRVCDALGGENQPNLQELISLLPIHNPSGYQEYWEWVEKEVEPAIVKVLVAANGCPACVLAALRQSNITAGATSFDFKKEMVKIWKIVNEANDTGAAY